MHTCKLTRGQKGDIVRNLRLVGGSGGIIDSLDSFKYVDSFSNETLLCCSETQNSSAVSSIETSSAILYKNSQYCITNRELCVYLIHDEEVPH